ncbi:glycosyltransferase, partial [Bacteroides acidifaciens]
MPKVSVIIPVYGVEKYIEQCVRSLFAQTLDDV